MKKSMLFNLPVAISAFAMAPQIHAAVNDATDASQQAVHHPSSWALIGLGSLLTVCFFVQRSR